jgi:ribonucleoside-diphosphate reductase alpha chain
MDLGLQALSSITVFSKYAKYIPDKNRRETWDEIVDRYQDMMINKYPALTEAIVETAKMIREKKILPSMRALQFAGPAAEVNNARIYNCFGAETKFVTSEGLKSFSDFNHGDETVVLTHLGNWKKAIVNNYGKQKLNNILIKRGKHSHTIRATENHRWILKNDEETTNLKIGDKLKSSLPIFNDFDYFNSDPTERLYWAYGYIFGDGTCLKDKSGQPKYSMVRLCGKDKGLFLDRFLEIGFKTSSSCSLNGDVMVYSGTYLKEAPNPSIDSPSLIRAFVSGYLDADGGKNNSQTSLSKFRSIVATGDVHKYVVEKLFPIAGVFISSSRDLEGKVTNFGTRGESKQYNISTDLTSSTNMSFVISDIKESVEEDVWCLEVEDDKSFVLEYGEVTGNCCYLPIDSIHSFSETMFLLLGGTGVGYSVQTHHVEQLPEIKRPTKSRNYLIEDSIMGWADAVKILMKAYLSGGTMPKFDFRAIREKGARLVTAGGKAPGPEPLKLCLTHVQAILDRKHDGEKLTSLECHDIMCHIANSVLAGGIRRSAMICLFDHTDESMITSKYGNWWETNEQRGRANNSAVLVHGEVSKEEFFALWKRVEASGSGEPGLYWSNNKDWGTNPCVEIALRPYQFCNLCDINVSEIIDQEDLNARVAAAAFFGTLQAGFTNFHYLRPIWAKTTQKDALLGIGMTGIGSGEILKYDLTIAAEVAKAVNQMISAKIGTNEAARITCIKPSGTTSLVLGTASGIHAWHNDYYLRTMRFNKNEDIAIYLMANHPELVEDDVLRPQDTICVRIPVKAPEGSILRTETAIDTLERVKHFSTNWIGTGHVTGENTHNVSATISIDSNRKYIAVNMNDGEGTKYNPTEDGYMDEWEVVGEWMWDNRKFYNGLSVLPYWGGSYVQAPFEDISEEKYNSLISKLKEIDITKIKEVSDEVNFSESVACGGGACDIV